MKRGKNYKAAVAAIDKSRLYDSNEALGLVCDLSKAKFDETVEVHVRLGVDSRHADQQVRGAVVLPHGTGKTVRVLAFVKENRIEEAKAAGADLIADDEIIKKIQGGWFEFDACVATPDMMGVVGSLGRLLGPRGLMPSPKAGTVTMELDKVVREYKAGKVEFRNDKGGIVHGVVGKLSFEADKLVENTQTFINYVNSLKPATVKGVYVKSIAISATMSPGLRVSLQ